MAAGGDRHDVQPRIKRHGLLTYYPGRTQKALIHVDQGVSRSHVEMEFCSGRFATCACTSTQRDQRAEASELRDALQRYSHSMVAGGLLEMSYTTRLHPRTSLMMRLDALASSS